MIEEKKINRNVKKSMSRRLHDKFESVFKCFYRTTDPLRWKRETFILLRFVYAIEKRKLFNFLEFVNIDKSVTVIIKEKKMIS